MINKLTRWEYHLKRYYEDDFVISDNGEWCDFEEVKELFTEQEKKTKILLDALEEIVGMAHMNSYDDCEGYCHVEAAREALEEYKKERE